MKDTLGILKEERQKTKSGINSILIMCVLCIMLGSCDNAIPAKYAVYKLAYYDSSCSEIYEFFGTREVYLITYPNGTYKFSPHNSKFYPYEGKYQEAAEWDAHVSTTFYLNNGDIQTAAAISLRIDSASKKCNIYFFEPTEYLDSFLRSHPLGASKNL